MAADRIRVLFIVFANRDVVRSQALTSRNLALRLDSDRFEATFFHTRPADPRLLERPGIRLISLPRRGGSLRVARELIWGPYDLVFYLQPGLQPEPAARAYWMLRRFGRRKQVVATVEASAEQIAALPPSFRRHYVAGLRRADAVYALSEYVRDSVRERFDVEIDERVIPLGVEPETFKAASRRRRCPPCRVLFVGHLVERKRPDRMLELARRLADRDAVVHLIGGGELATAPFLADLKGRAPSNVFFHGVLPPSEIGAWMAKADLFVLPSHLEGLPRVTVEAAAAGLPCVVFDDYRTPSVVDGVTGFQVGDFEALVDRVRFLIDNPRERWRMGEAAVRHAQGFAWRHIAGVWQEVFEELTA